MLPLREVFCVFILLLISVLALFKGENCTTDDSALKGQCTLIEECPTAKEILSAQKQPTLCGFEKRTPIICCPTKSEIQKSNNISANKCAEYHRRKYRPGWGIASGIRTQPREFPHMALLGYGNKSNVNWLCGGSLISDDFILTAGHCTTSKEFGGDVQWVRLGELDLSSINDDAKPKDYSVSKIFKHPDYRPPSHYNDIALLKLDRKAQLSSYVKPACLYTNFDAPSPLIVTGWGKTSFAGESSSHLLKIEIDHIQYNDCAKYYASVSKAKLKNGIMDRIQVCAGDSNGKDACPGDSGGPIQFKQYGFRVENHYEIIGITSFGKGCGVDKTIGVYTRVAPFVSWIENIVWG